jgi:hypothetical protein
MVTDRLDVAARLAEGRPATEHTQRYVQACQILGYQHPDLTSHPAQVRDWYDSEDGLDLRTLDSDCAKLRAAAAAVSEALRSQRAQIAALDAAWRGPGAASAIWFLQRHCDAASVVVAEVRAAAQRCESLRDNLWQLLDTKVATAIDIDDRTGMQRPAWLAAVDAITIGAGDRPTAEEVVRGQVKPYVDNDIRVEWVTAMRSAQAGVAASYDMVTDRFAGALTATFELPGDLGPGGQPLQPAPPIAPTPPTAAVAPVAAVPSLPPDPVPPATPMPPGLDSPQVGLALPPGVGTGGGLGGSSGLDGLSGLSGLDGLGGLANRIIEGVGGLLGPAGNPPTFDDPLDPEDPFEAEHEAEEAEEADEPDEAEEEDFPDAAEAKAPLADQTPPAEQRPPAAPPPDDAPPPVVLPPLDVPPPVAPPAKGPPPSPSGGSTPCEIAADQLPQAGP